MGPRWQYPPSPARAVEAWIRREFAVRGLLPPHCTPEALARTLERERQIAITFHPHASEDPGVYGLLYRQEAAPSQYVIVFRQTRNLALRRLILFHELAHLLFEHALTEVGGVGALRGFLVSDADDAAAEAFAVGAMHYSFLDTDESTAAAEAEDWSATGFGDIIGGLKYQYYAVGALASRGFRHGAFPHRSLG